MTCSMPTHAFVTCEDCPEKWPDAIIANPGLRITPQNAVAPESAEALRNQARALLPHISSPSCCWTLCRGYKFGSVVMTVLVK